MFLSTNPCWPFYDCTIALPIPDPVAYLKWQVIEQVVQESGGHCFGISRFVQEIGAGRITNGQFATGVTTTFGLPSRSGPSGRLGSYLDHRHAGQTTKEFLLTLRPALRLDLRAAQPRCARELDRGPPRQPPAQEQLHRGPRDHRPRHRDAARRLDGHPHLRQRARVHPRRRRPTPTAPPTATARPAARSSSTPPRRAGTTAAGTAATTARSTSSTLTDWPAGTAPTLPGVVDAIIGIFGSDGGAAVTGPEPKGAEILPVLDRGAIPGAAGFVIGEPETKSVSARHGGQVKDGTYSQTIMGGGFIGSVNDVKTAKGVTDRLSGNPGDDTITFAGERTRVAGARGRLGAQVGEPRRDDRHADVRRRRRDGVAARRVVAASTSTTAPPTRFSFELQSVERGASAAHFKSGSLTIRKGERIVAKPADWRRLDSVRVDRAPRERQGHDAPRAQPRASPVKIAVSKLCRAQGRRPQRGEGHDAPAQRRRPAASSASRCACSATAARSRARASRSSSRATRRGRSRSSCPRACAAGPTGCRPTSWSRRRARSRARSASRGGRSCGSADRRAMSNSERIVAHYSTWAEPAPPGSLARRRGARADAVADRACARRRPRRRADPGAVQQPRLARRPRARRAARGARAAAARTAGGRSRRRSRPPIARTVALRGSPVRSDISPTTAPRAHRLDRSLAPVVLAQDDLDGARRRRRTATSRADPARRCARAARASAAVPPRASSASSSRVSIAKIGTAASSRCDLLDATAPARAGRSTGRSRRSS